MPEVTTVRSHVSNKKVIKKIFFAFMSVVKKKSKGSGIYEIKKSLEMVRFIDNGNFEVTCKNEVTRKVIGIG